MKAGPNPAVWANRAILENGAAQPHLTQKTRSNARLLRAEKPNSINRYWKLPAEGQRFRCNCWRHEPPVSEGLVVGGTTVVTPVTVVGVVVVVVVVVPGPATI